ncbi:MAG: 6-phosphogluconolactonase [Nitrospirales bacterium]|nr:MAG: 6-phosphogluconolactonase [Nitrospirales bacterium]
MVFMSVATHASAAEFLYLASGNTISVKVIDQTTGTLRDHQTLALDGTGPITISPEQSFLYIVEQQLRSKRQPFIATYAIGNDGKLTLQQQSPINMQTEYVDADATGQYLTGSHYGKGKMSVWRLTEGVYEGETVQEFTLEQKAHSTVFSQDNRYILVPATGPNKVFQMTFDETTGRVALNTPAFASGPTSGARQPRHLMFNRQLPIVYTTQERIHPGVATWEWNPEKGTLTLIENIVTTHDDVKSITTADLHITPDNTFLYISNRDDKKKRDSIIGFRIDSENGRLSLIKHFPSEHIPRSFCISKSGTYLYVAGKGDAKLGAYEIHADTGELEKITQYQTGANPIWVTTLVK